MNNIEYQRMQNMTSRRISKRLRKSSILLNSILFNHLAIFDLGGNIHTDL